MRLKVLTPTQILIDTPIEKVDFEAVDGYFTLLPKHIDFINSLKQTIVQYQVNNKSYYVACDRGVVVKKSDEVIISTALAISDDNLEKLKKTIEVDFKQMEQERKEVLVSMSKLEVGLTKGLMNLTSMREAKHVGI
ncbi:MAG: hypothetical protein E7021_02870 [Alphaproteobacteria bacterium]|nr:hypothetical protein [Alphaproteobacteria bacterium]